MQPMFVWHGAVQRCGARQPTQGGGQNDGGRNDGGSSLFAGLVTGRPARIAGLQAGVDGGVTAGVAVATAGGATLACGAAGAAGDAGALAAA